MLQFLIFDEPIPSCSIYGLKYENEKWKFIYALNTPFELTDENSQEMIIYEYISDLTIKESKDLHPDSTNIKFKTLSEYLKILRMQIDEDKKFRENYFNKLIESGEKIPEPNTIELNHKDYNYSELKEIGVHFISKIYDDKSFTTIFAAI